MFRLTVLRVSVVLVGILAYLIGSRTRSPSTERRNVDVYSKDRWFAAGEKDETVLANEEIIPYTIEIPEEYIQDMYSKLKSARLINQSIRSDSEEEEEDWSYGVPFSVAQKVTTYFAKEYNWTKHQHDMNNRFPQYMTTIAGLDTHFIHIKSKDGLPPLMLIHGWPGSFLEFSRIIPLLSPHFELVIPSLPGYGFSQGASRRGMNIEETSISLIQLMIRLGHNQFYLQGGDWGSLTAQKMTQLVPERVLGLQLNFFPGNMPLPWGPFQIVLSHICPALLPLEMHDIVKLQNYKQSFFEVLSGLGYFYQQSTRPDTLGYGLTDSPMGLSMWILEKFFTWTDVTTFEELLERFDLDELLTNASLYYLTGSVTTAARFYKEHAIYSIQTKNEDATRPLPSSVPVGLSDFPGEIMRNQPFAWAKLKFPGLISMKHHSQGGHFAAMEQYEALASDIRSFVEAIKK